MLRTIAIWGAAAGVVVITPFLLLLIHYDIGAGHSVIVGYLIMLLALSLVFVGVKRYRDRDLGGVIRFFPALACGLGISLVASVIYVVGWEVDCAVSHYDFGEVYAKAMIASAQAKHAAPAELARVTAQAQAFKAQYANPFYRWPMTFIEVFPVGVVISLVSAALLRNARFLPARTAAK